ncbi:MAG: DNA polymerase III subunit beta [Mucinivorans sp.]
MKFIISSTLLSQNLQSIGKVIATKNTLPILDYFLFELKGEQLSVTASDLETTLSTTIEVENVEQLDGSVAVPARRITDSIKEFSEQPLTISIDKESWEIVISWRSGKLSIPGITGMGYPEAAELGQGNEPTRVQLPSEVLGYGISSTIFATADDPLRPVMNGINIALTPTEITFVATDAHRMVRFIDTTIKTAIPSSFILPAKPAQLLRSVLPRDSDTPVELIFDNKNVIFELPKHRLVCRLIEGNYPNYNAVIPQNNNNKLTVDRTELLGAIKRVAVCSNQASGLVQFSLKMGNLTLTAQDVDFATSAEDNIACDFSGDSLEIGFKSAFLLDLLTNIHSQEVIIELADATRPGLFLPVDEVEEGQSLLMLQMPMMINA